MAAHKRYLLFIAFFTLLFIALIALGSWLLSEGSRQFGVAAFLFAFGAAFGQIASLALYLRYKAHREAAAKLAQQSQQQEQPHAK